MTTPVATTLTLRSLLEQGAPLPSLLPLLDTLAAQVAGMADARRSVFVSGVFRSAIASPTPGALAAVILRGFLPAYHPHSPVLSHTAFSTVDPAQHEVFLHLLAADLDRVLADPTAPLAFTWYGWASAQPSIDSLLLAYGLERRTVRSSRSVPFAVIRRHPAWQERAIAILASCARRVDMAAA